MRAREDNAEELTCAIGYNIFIWFFICFLNRFQHSTAEYCSNVFTELPSVTPRPPSSASTANSASNVCKFRIVFLQLHLDKTKLSCNNHPVT